MTEIRVVGDPTRPDEHRAWIEVDGDQPREIDLERSLRVVRHSPTGFGWGYTGSGPSQLALAILLDATDNEWEAQTLYMTFKFDTVAEVRDPDSPFAFTVDLDEWRRLGKRAVRWEYGHWKEAPVGNEG